MSESDSPQPVTSDAEIDALEYVVHQGIIAAYDRPILLAWLARLQAERTPEPPSTPSEGTRQSGCIVTRLRQTRANMIGTDDEQHYFDCHEAAGEIERLRQWVALTDAEREAIRRAIDVQEHRAADMHPRSWIAADIDDDCDTLRGLLERTKTGEK